MKVAIFVVILLFSISVMAEVNQGTSCSTVTQVCALYSSDAPFVTNQEGRFTLSLQSKDLVGTELVKVDLWMQMGRHGHGSSPLKVTQLAPGEFDITKAFFVMKGAWQIRVHYKQNEVQETLIIPVEVKK